MKNATHKYLHAYDEDDVCSNIIGIGLDVFKASH